MAGVGRERRRREGGDQRSWMGSSYSEETGESLAKGKGKKETKKMAKFLHLVVKAEFSTFVHLVVKAEFLTPKCTLSGLLLFNQGQREERNKEKGKFSLHLVVKAEFSTQVYTFWLLLRCQRLSPSAIFRPTSPTLPRPTSPATLGQ
ncbi:hypothetical protein CsSME_00049092 [Camellia sinensis var. sinensis]